MFPEKGEFFSIQREQAQNHDSSHLLSSVKKKNYNTILMSLMINFKGKKNNMSVCMF
jgi:hypothetical protein